jgi:hypothetical protein
MNILRERKRSKVFKRKCFYLYDEATPGISGENMPARNSSRPEGLTIR